jgi:hypothetical protein
MAEDSCSHLNAITKVKHPTPPTRAFPTLQLAIQRRAIRGHLSCLDAISPAGQAALVIS